ncbi:MAG: ubiquinol-cytochrome c reductase iron-sulfur subunit [Vicinamibacterales bacterium]
MAHGCGIACGRTRRDFLTTVPGLVLAALVAGDAATAEASYAVVEMTGVSAGGQQKAYPLPAADGVTIDKASQVILVRFQGKVIAFNLACPHENNALRWKPAVGRFQCSKHDSKYAPDGKYLGGRATRNMDRLPITRDGDRVVVDLSRIVKSDADPAEWAAAMIAL